MTANLYHFGYGGNANLQKFQRWMALPKDTTCPVPLVIDCRQNPHTTYHEWDQNALYTQYGERYRYAGKYLGNPNYNKPGAPRRIANYPIGKRGIEQYLKEGHDLILLCGCANYFSCHLQFLVDQLLIDLPQLLLPCLSISQPYAWLILHPELLLSCGIAPRCVDNRALSQDTQYRGPLYLHTGKTPSDDFYGPQKELALSWKRRVGDALYAQMPKRFSDYPTGGIVGKATLEEVVTNSREAWAIAGQRQYLLSNVQTLPFVPCSGDLGIFALPASLLQGSI